MTPLIFWKRKPLLTAVWALVIAAMTVFLSTGFSLFYTTGALPSFVEENNKTVALIGESHTTHEAEDGYYVTSPTAITDEEYDSLMKMDSVKAVHINTVTGAYSDSFYASLPWEPYGGLYLGGANEPYNNGIAVGKVIGVYVDDTMKGADISLDGAEARRYERRMYSVSISVEKLFLFNDVFTDNVFSDFKFVELDIVCYTDDDNPLLKMGDRAVFYIDNYRYLGNSAGPAATCLTGNLYSAPDRGLQIIDRDGELVSFGVSGAEYERVEVPFINEDGIEGTYEREELALLKGYTDESHIPVMSRLEVSLEDFLADPENGDWQRLFTHLETVNSCLPVVGTDCLEGQYAFVTDRAKITEGRAFTEEEYLSGARVLIISRAVAEKGNVKAGDSVKLSQFLLNRESGRCDDYPDGVIAYRNRDYVININPTVGSFISSPRYAQADAEFTVVGIYEQSEEWTDNMFSFTPNTVFMPKGAQIDGGYGALSYYEEGSAEPVRCGAEGIGLVVEIKNGMMDEFREEIAKTEMAEYFLVFDQGYEESIIPARLLASMGRSLFIIVFCGWLILLILYVILYQLRQNKTLGVMRSVGATPAEAGRYVFVCGMVPAILGVSVGCAVGMLLLSTVQSRIFTLILNQGDIAAESSRFSALLSQNVAEPASLIPACALQICIFAAVLGAVSYFVSRRPPRKLSSD